jgi:hypothetical protein
MKLKINMEAVKKKAKKMELTLPEIKKDVKPYKVLRTNPKEVRIYPPAKRTILTIDGTANGKPHFLQLPYLILGFYPHGSEGGYLFGCFSTEDLSQLSEEELMKTEVFIMPFPAQLDNGCWGPCCLVGRSPYYFFPGNFDALVRQFYQTSFRGFGDYSQKNIACWSEMTLDQVNEMLKKAPAYYKAPFKTFLESLDTRKL